MAVTLTPVSRIEVEQTSVKPTGAAGAALLSGGLGLFAMSISQVMAEGSEAAKTAIHNLGKLWIPGAQGIGPYSGKETIALAVWLVSWAILHYVLRRREINLTAYGIAFLLLIGLSTTIFWPPATHAVVQAFYPK
ncbi:MAG TPA: hypothetical protein VFX49_03110 [Chloroflexota bacterium]|nr:hypothetical protein [Chloroflexota bacterium]